MNCKSDAIIDAAIADIAQRDDISYGMALLWLVRYALNLSASQSGIGNTLAWVHAVINGDIKPSEPS